MSVFLLQFMMKFADKLVGKGLSIWIIIKLIAYNLAWMVVLVVPMATLISTLMAFGTMSQNNEIAILKASGISLYKMIIPPVLLSILLAGLLVLFNNHVYPDANHQARLLMQDISRKKPTLSLVPGVFSQEVSSYSILAREVDQNSNELKDVTIYDNTYLPKINIITAKKGKIFFSVKTKKLILDLYDGEIHESNSLQKEIYRKLIFQRHKITMPGDQFTFEQSAPGGPKGDRELGASEMLVIVDSLDNINKELTGNFNKVVSSFAIKKFPEAHNGERISKEFLIYRVAEKIRNQQSLIMSNLDRIQSNIQESNSYWVEINKKYSLPVACIIFIFIGAPLGIMTRKGGFGIAAGISLFFFLIYWAFLIGGEKLADRGLFSPFWGMWSANIIMGIFGVILTVKSAKEAIFLNFDFFKKLIPKTWRTEEPVNENN